MEVRRTAPPRAPRRAEPGPDSRAPTGPFVLSIQYSVRFLFIPPSLVIPLRARALGLCALGTKAGSLSEKKQQKSAHRPGGVFAEYARTHRESVPGGPAPVRAHDLKSIPMAIDGRI